MHRQVFLVCLLALSAALSGCSRGAEVTRTVPRAGGTVAQSTAEIQLHFSTDLEAASAVVEGFYSITGSASGTRSFAVELEEGTSGGENRLVKLIPGDEADDFGFVEGETVTAKVTRGVLTFNGIPVQSHTFQFRISAVAGAPADFEPGETQVVVRETSPAGSTLGSGLLPTIAVELASGVSPSTVASGAMVLRGSASGVRSVNIASTIASGTVRQFAVSLGSGQKPFLPGERVSLSLLDDLALLGSEATPQATLRPYALEFFTANGQLTGSIGAPQMVAPDPAPRAVVGMVAGDHLFYTGLELVVLDEDLGLLLMRRQGNGWTLVSSYNEFAGTPVWLGQADVDNDRKLELVVLTRAAARAYFFRVQAEQLAALPALSQTLTGAPQAAALADLDGDGFLDLAVGQANGLTVLGAQPTLNTDVTQIINGVTFVLGGYTPRVVSQSGVHALAVADLYNDGRLDLVVGNSLGLGIYRNAGGLSFLRVVALEEASAQPGVALAIGEVLDNGTTQPVPEILSAGPDGVRLHAASGEPDDRSWSSSVLTLAEGAPDALGLADLDGDGRNDLITYRRAANLLSLRPGADGAVFAAPLVQHGVSASLAAPRLAFLDLNGDGGRDIVLGGSTGAAGGLFLASTSGVAAPPAAPTFSFTVPAQVQAPLGQPEFAVTVSGVLGQSIRGFTMRLAFDAEDLELVRIEAHPGTFEPGTVEVSETIHEQGENSSGVAVVTLETLLASSAPVPLVDFVFALRSTELTTHGYRLANDTAGGVANEVETGSGSTVLVSLAGATSGSVHVTTSVPGVEGLTCTPRTEENVQGQISHFIDVAWQIPSGASYDSGPGSILVSLNGNQVAGLTGVATAVTVPGVQAGQNTITVLAHQGGLASAPVNCGVYLVPAPSQFECERVLQSSPVVQLSWHNNASYSSLRIYRDGSQLFTLSGSFSSWSDTTASAQGGHRYEIEGVQQATIDGEVQQQNSSRVVCQVDDEDADVTPPIGVTLAIQGLNDVLLSWTNAESYDAIEVRRNGQLVTSPALSGTATSFLDTGLAPGAYSYLVRFIVGMEFAEVPTSPPSTADLGGGIQLPAPTGLTCSTAIGAGVLFSPEVDLMWSNPVPYDSIVVTRLLAGTADAQFSLIGTAVDFTDLGVAPGAYLYRVEGIVDGVASTASPTCAVTLQNGISAQDLTTAVGRTGELLEVRARLLQGVAGFSFALRWNVAVAIPSTPPVVLLPSGVPLPANQVTLIPGSGGQATLHVLAPQVLLPAGAEVVLARIQVDTAASFSAVGVTPLTLLEGSLGGAEVESLGHATLTVAGDALIIDDQVAVTGGPLDLAVYGTFDQAIAGATVLLAFDPQVVTLVDVTVDGTVLPSALLFETFDNAIGYSSAAVISIPGSGSSSSAAPAAHAPLIYYSFEVSVQAPPGADTGIRLVAPEELPVMPLLPRSLYSSATGQSVTPILLSGSVTVQQSLAPFITAVSPEAGSIYGGEELTITGQQLAGAQLSVLIGGQPATVLSATAQALVVLAPQPSSTPTSDTPVAINVSHALGFDSVPAAYQYRLARVNAIEPSTPGLAGQARMLVGSYFPASSAGTSVRFGSVAATVLGIDETRTQLTVVVPPGSGAVEVAATFPGQPEVVMPGGFQYQAPPTIISIAPVTGPLLGGSNATISATGLGAGQISVLIGGQPAPVTSLAADHVIVTVPAFGGSTAVDVAVDVTLTTAAGPATSPGLYTYRVLTLSGLAPAQGNPAGGTPLTISGAGLAAAGTVVTFGAVPATVTGADPAGASLAVISPAGSGSVDVTVTLADGQTAMLPGAFQYAGQAFFVTQITPTHGSACGGELVSITGGGFEPGQMQVRFGTSLATEVSVDPSGDELTCSTPVGGEGVVSVIVSHLGTGQEETFPDAFTFGFVRGDVNGDGAVNMADLAFLSNYVLGSGPAPHSLDAADVNDDGQVHVGDVTFLASFLAQVTPVVMPAPYPSPGADPTLDALDPCN